MVIPIYWRGPFGDRISHLITSGKACINHHPEKNMSESAHCIVRQNDHALQLGELGVEGCDLASAGALIAACHGSEPAGYPAMMGACAPMVFTEAPASVRTLSSRTGRSVCIPHRPMDAMSVDVCIIVAFGAAIGVMMAYTPLRKQGVC